MKLSRNKIAKLLKIGNQSRKNIKKQHKGRSKTLGADSNSSKAYLLSEDEMIMVPDNNNKNKNKRRARSAHLKPKPLNLRFKTLKNRIIREEKREWSGEGGNLTADQQKVYDLLLEQKKNNNNDNQDILTVLTAGMQGDADLALDGKFTVRFDELLKTANNSYEVPGESNPLYAIAASTRPTDTDANPEVDFFTKILKGELYYLIDVEDIPKVVTYISSQPELKEIIAFKGADAEKKGGAPPTNARPNPTLESISFKERSEAEKLAARSNASTSTISTVKDAISKIIKANKPFIDNPSSADINAVFEIKKELRTKIYSLSESKIPNIVKRLQSLNVLAKIEYFYKKMSPHDYVQHQKTSAWWKLQKTGKQTEALGSKSKIPVSQSDLDKFEESKKYLTDLLVEYRKYSGSIITGSTSSLEPQFFFSAVNNDIDPIRSKMVTLEQSFQQISTNNIEVQKDLYDSYTAQSDGGLTIEQMITKSAGGAFKKFMIKNMKLIKQVIQQVNETIIPKARAFSTKTSKDAETKTAATAAQEVAGKKAGEDKAKQALVQAAQTIVDSLTTVATYAEATATDSTEIEHKDDISNEIKKIEEAAAKLSTTAGAGALPSSPALPPSAAAAAEKEGEGAAEDIKNDPRVKITLNSFNKSLGKLKALLRTTTTATTDEVETNLEGQGGGGKPEVITALKSLQTALAATPPVQETITTEARKVTEALATIKETDKIDTALKEQITAALTIPTKESIDPILVQLQAPPEEVEGTGTGTGQEPLKKLLTELTPNPASVEAASATNPDIKTTTADALQKANELLAAVTAAAKLGAATAAKPVAPVAPVAPSQLSDAEIQALKKRVEDLEKKAAAAGKDKDDETEAAIKAIMMGDDAFAHKIQFLVDIPKWQQFKVIGSTDGSMEDAALNMTTDIARASLSDLKKKELDDQKEARKLMGEQLQAIEALKLKMMEKLDPKEQLETEKKANDAIAELQKKLADIIKRLQSEPQREATVVNSAAPLGKTTIDASANPLPGAQPGAQLGATPIITQLQSDTYKIPSSATKDNLAPIIAALKTLVTPQVIETNKSDDKFKTAFGAKLTEIVNAAKSVEGYDASKTPANTTEALIKDLPADFTLPKVNTILENITKLLPAVVIGGKRLSHHLTKRNNKNRHHGKYTFRNLRGGVVPVKGAATTPAPPGATTPATPGDAPPAETPPGATPAPPGDAPATEVKPSAPPGDAPVPPGDAPAPPGDAPAKVVTQPATEETEEAKKAAADKKFAELQAVLNEQQNALAKLNVSPETNATAVVDPTAAATTEETTEEAAAPPATGTEEAVDATAAAANPTASVTEEAANPTASVTGATEEVNLDVILTEIHNKNKDVLTCSTWKPSPNIGTCPKQEEFFNAFEQTLKLIPEAVVQKYAKLNKTDLEKYIPLIPDKGACKQVVIGTLEDLPPYLYYNKLLMEQKEDAKFSILAAKGWTEGLNQEFVTCAVESHINGQTSCDFAVRLLIPNNPKRMVKQLNGVPSPRITYLELCIVNDIIKTAKDRSISTHKYTGDYPNKSDAENGFDMYFLKIAPPTAQASVGQPQAAPPAQGTGGYKRHTRKNKTKKNRKNSKKSKTKKSKKSKKRK